MKIALVHNWPGIKNSELDLISRIKSVLDQLGHDSQIVNVFGEQLEGEHADFPKHSLAPITFDFALYFHYLAPKIIDTYSYSVNWNPLRYILFEPLTGRPASPELLRFILKNFQSHDYILSASSEIVDRFVEISCYDSLWSPVFSDLNLHTTCQHFSSLPPIDLTTFKVFYIAANWEKINKNNKQIRHEELLKRLDESEIFSFYGRREQHGRFVWEGISSYRGELPFDGGYSIVNTCNQHGVALVLSSEAHRESELVSTRLFQACAAGAVIISDDNPFVVQNFGDSVLTFSLNDDPETTFLNIMEKVQWIKEHPDLALEKARQSHEIFRTNYLLNEEILRIVEAHQKNAAEDFESYDVLKDYVIDVFWYAFDEKDLEYASRFLDNLKRQKFVNVKGWILTDPMFAATVRKIISDFAADDSEAVFDFILLNRFHKRTRGDLLLEAFENHAAGNFFTFWAPEIKWHSRHVAFLLKDLYYTGSDFVQAASVVINDWCRKEMTDYYEILPLSTSAIPRLKIDHIYMNDPVQIHPSFFLFSSKLVWKSWEQAQVVRLLDAGFVFALLLLFFLESKRLPSFVPRFSCEYHSQDDAQFEGRSAPVAEDFLLAEEKRALYPRQVEKVILSNFFYKSRDYRLHNEIYRTSVETSSDSDVTAKQQVSNTAPVVSEDFSVNRYMLNLLNNRPWLQKAWKFFFRVMKRILKL